jgi:hypothetical protein
VGLVREFQVPDWQKVNHSHPVGEANGVFEGVLQHLRIERQSGDATTGWRTNLLALWLFE